MEDWGGLLVITWIVQGIYNYRFRQAIKKLEDTLIEHLRASGPKPSV